MQMADQYVVVLTTLPADADASTLARALVARGSVINSVIATVDMNTDVWRATLGLNDPLPTQLVIWSGKLLQTTE